MDTILQALVPQSTLTPTAGISEAWVLLVDNRVSVHLAYGELATPPRT